MRYCVFWRPAGPTRANLSFRAKAKLYDSGEQTGKEEGNMDNPRSCDEQAEMSRHDDRHCQLRSSLFQLFRMRRQVRRNQGEINGTGAKLEFVKLSL